MSFSQPEKKDLAKVYQKKTDKQHVLDNPDTYTGSMDPVEQETYVYNSTTESIVSREITLIPGMYKLFDEAIVNCRDHQVRQQTAVDSGTTDAQLVSKIEVTVQDNVITMYNNGDGIDVAKHPDYNVWIPELIFGHMRTSTNYDKSEKRIVGGKNGFGFKLVLIWSTEGIIETVDATRRKKYVQRFRNNLDIIEPPTVTSTSVKPYTRISFKPDLARLGIDSLSDDMISLFHKRVLDIAAVTDKKVTVKYNGSIVPVKNFQGYVDLYIGTKKETPRVYECANSRWEYAVALSPSDEFTQVSFVNGIFTSKGGKHVDYILGQITRKMSSLIKKKRKLEVKPSAIKEQIMLFIRCDIHNPSFDSQTKDYMSSPSSSFGSDCTVSDKFIEQIAKMGVMDAACALTEVKQTKKIKQGDGSKVKTLRGFPKLIDANDAGTSRSAECTLFLVEGDSAKAGVVSGLTQEDRKTIGVYPMRGKLFNVRDEPAKRIAENKEVSEIKQIMGLETGKTYTAESARKSLRYGRIIFLTDQDLDGSHIKGLGINLIDSQWQTLTQIPEFIGFMNTPILKAKRGSEEKQFYNEGEYNKWKQLTHDSHLWKVKYYKGLGTSTGKEFKEYLANRKYIFFENSGPESHSALDKVFNKKRASDRKEWLGNYDPNRHLDTTQNHVRYEEFIDREMIHFSKYDNDRSIPSMVDGLKTSLRKILFTVFKRRITKELKVAQLSGSVSELSGYHHGEASLNGGIIGMAQDFVGSNNINLLQPNGQFGTRLEGGKDAASERYIFTELNPLTRIIFPSDDDRVLEYLDDDGNKVEPRYYVPIIPMICINGCKGIGTGFSTDIPPCDPIEVMNYIECRLTDQSTDHIKLKPYYHGFRGTVTTLTDTKYLIKGLYTVTSPTTIRITELPVGLWTSTFKKHLEDIIMGSTDKKTKTTSVIKDYADNSTDRIVDFTIEFVKGAIQELTQKSSEMYCCNALEKLLKLYTTVSTSNMHAFDQNDRLCNYASINDIIESYIPVRYALFETRKSYLIDELSQVVTVLTNKARFITAILANPPEIDIRGKHKASVEAELQQHGFDKVDNDYKYLLRMPLDIQTLEEVEQLIATRDAKTFELETLRKTTPSEMWLSELQTLRTTYQDRMSAITKANEHDDKTTVTTIKKSKTKVVRRNLKIKA